MPSKHDASKSLQPRVGRRAPRPSARRGPGRSAVGADLARDLRPRCGRSATSSSLGRHVDAVDVRDSAPAARPRRSTPCARRRRAPSARSRAEVVPRTIESSTSSTFLPLNSMPIAFSFWRTDFLRIALPRHDEGAADVAVLDEALAVLHAELLRELAARTAGSSRESGSRRRCRAPAACARIFSRERARPCAGAPRTPRCRRSPSRAARGRRTRRCTG